MSQQEGNRKKMKRYNTGNEILTALMKSQKKKKDFGRLEQKGFNQDELIDLQDRSGCGKRIKISQLSSTSKTFHMKETVGDILSQ